MELSVCIYLTLSKKVIIYYSKVVANLQKFPPNIKFRDNLQPSMCMC